MSVALTSSLFKPEVSIPSVPVAGDSFAITCILDGVVETLVGVKVDVEFINPPGRVPTNQSLEGSAYVKQLIFNPVKTSDVGDYTCQVVISDLGKRPLMNYGNATLQIKS